MLKIIISPFVGATCLIALCMIALCGTPVQAQKGLAVEGLFGDDFQKSQGVTAVTVSGSALAGSGMSLYRSVTVERDAASVADMRRRVTTDGARAESKEISVKDGHLRYGFYELKSKGDNRRYLFFLDKSAPGRPAAMIVYIESSLSADELKKRIFSEK